MRTLVLCDGYRHSAGTARAGLAPLAASGFAFDWIEHADHWSAKRMHDYRVVLLTNDEPRLGGRSAPLG